MQPGPARLTARSCVVAALVIAFAAPASPAAPEGPGAEQLRRREATLSDRAGSALARLSALERSLAAARADLAAVRARAAAHARRVAAVEARLRLAGHNVRAAQRGLGVRLRELYVTGSPEPLEVLLGARSLQAAVDALDGLEVTAERDRDLVAATSRTSTRLVALRRRLARQAAALRRAEATAAAHARTLEQARARKAAYIARLHEERRLTSERIAALARRAQAEATAVPAPPTASAALPTARTLSVVASGYALRGQTASGIEAGWGIVAVDPAVIPLGTRMTIPGYGEGVAADVGSAVQGAEIDLWFPSEREALVWGRRPVTITLHSGAAE